MYDRRARYVDDAISTASPQHLLCLLYDRLALDVQRAEAALADGNHAAATELAKHAQDIVFELRATLDTDAWDGGPALASLYGWLISQLGKVIVSGDVDAAAACYRIVEPLRLAWREAASSGVEAPRQTIAATA